MVIVFANSEDPDEMSPGATFNLDVHWSKESREYDACANPEGDWESRPPGKPQSYRVP